MQKVVINKRFGGFGISPEALYELIKMKSKCVKKTPVKKYYGGKDGDWQARYKKDIETRCHKFKDGFLIYDMLGVLYKNDYAYHLMYQYEKIFRTNSDLIAVVEQMKEKANGCGAKLKVVKIPNGVDFTIEEYNGREHVAEEHRTWE